ncbi:hypothetical protein Tcan_04194 [Toxocara canis]|uniref:Uncharacterized protein n=1 Tax=Toxocara canis TaxID=6265 RepID=A0A0B2VV58_TOXCA|nr:hypothetical protein Tcan_04194 [Toxocara canis]
MKRWSVKSSIFHAMDDSDFTEESSSKAAIKRAAPSLNGGKYSGGGPKAKRSKVVKVEADPVIVEPFLGEPVDRPAVDQAHVSPSQMITIVQASSYLAFQFLPAKKRSPLVIKIEQLNLSRFLQAGSRKNRRFLTFTDYDAIGLPDGVTSEMARADVKRYLKEAVSLSSMTLKSAVDLLSSFLAEGSSITMDPAFPRKPPNAFNLFIRNNVAPGADIKESMVTHSAHWKCNSYMAEKEVAEKEALGLQKLYLQQLIEYKDKHKELNEAHSSFVNKLINSTRKLVDKAEGTDMKSPRRPKQTGSKKDSKAPKTPFELFCMSSADKYADLEPEKRERKLRKKFEKLGDAEREIYNKLAAAL